MRQTICVIIVVAVAMLLNIGIASRMAADGNWGEAVGRLFFAPMAVFFLVHSAVYYGVRLMRGPGALASFSTSRLNYIAFTVAMLGVLGSVAQRMAPPA